jgi:hypothetical protein
MHGLQRWPMRRIGSIPENSELVGAATALEQLDVFRVDLGDHPDRPG